MIVVDASAALAGLLNAGHARRSLRSERLHAPHLIDSEVANGLRRRAATGDIDANAGWRALNVWRQLGVARYPIVGSLERIWQLRENLSAYDATYVALAEQLGCPLLTGDQRLTRAPGIRCAITIVPR